MSLLQQSGTLTQAVEAAIRDAIPGAEVSVSGGGGHFSIRVVSSAFEGLSMVAKHRKVLSAVAPFMAGDDAPVHAIDHLDILLPE